MNTFIEDTNDKGYEKRVYARDNNATYILTSAWMHDRYDDYIERYGKNPTAAWYRRHACFKQK